MPRRTLIAGVFAMSLTVAGCASDDGPARTGRGETDPGASAVTGPDGTLTYARRLPPGFPNAVPIPTGARVVNSTTNGTTFSATLERSATTPTAVIADYRVQLAGAEFLAAPPSGTPFESVAAFGAGWSVNLIVSPADDTVVLSLSVAPA